MRYYMLNKPCGYVSARCDKYYPAVMNLIPENNGLHISGRLDRDAQGLLIITDDGDLTFRLTRPEFGITKTYFFRAFGEISLDDIRKIETGGLPLGDGSLSKPAKIFDLEESMVSDNEKYLPDGIKMHCMKNPNGMVVSGRITVSEGKFHEVKQLLHDVGCRIFVLKREKIGDIILDGNLKDGEYRKFNDGEIKICEKYRELYIENL